MATCLHIKEMHGHRHEHNHGHARQLKSLNFTYYLAIALNLGYVILEVAIGMSHNSVGLLSDAGHKLTDVLSLIIALVAFKLTASRPGKRYTYGLRKTSVLISLLNALILLFAVCVIIIESIEKLVNPEPVDGLAISWTAGIGIIVSGVSAFLLMAHQKGDINTRGAFLHMATDALVSAGVVVSGIIISVSGWYFVDPLISVLVALVILYNTCRLLAESFRMSVDAVPDRINYDEIREMIEKTEGVEGLSRLHIWSVSVFDTALTVHLQVKEECERDALVGELHRTLGEAGISEVTIECTKSDKTL